MSSPTASCSSSGSSFSYHGLQGSNGVHSGRLVGVVGPLDLHWADQQLKVSTHQAKGKRTQHIQASGPAWRLQSSERNTYAWARQPPQARPSTPTPGLVPSRSKALVRQWAALSVFPCHTCTLAMFVSTANAYLNKQPRDAHTFMLQQTARWRCSRHGVLKARQN